MPDDNVWSTYERMRQPPSPDERDPRMEILDKALLETPRFPQEVLGAYWMGVCSDISAATQAPFDYAAAPLLSGSAALIGNARHGKIGGWTEPTALWCSAVGDPSASKTPPFKSVQRMLRPVERQMALDYPETLRAWQERAAAAKSAKAAWLAAVDKAVNDCAPPPPMPPQADNPPPTRRCRASCMAMPPRRSCKPTWPGCPRACGRSTTNWRAGSTGTSATTPTAPRSGWKAPAAAAAS